MKIFVDTGAWIALADKNDQFHHVSKKIYSSIRRTFKVSESHISQAWDLFQKFHDQKFSFTDCISFILMPLSGTSMVFSYDSHFSTMGFCVIGKNATEKNIFPEAKISKRNK